MIHKILKACLSLALLIIDWFYVFIEQVKGCEFSTDVTLCKSYSKIKMFPSEFSSIPPDFCSDNSFHLIHIKTLSLLCWRRSGIHHYNSRLTWTNGNVISLFFLLVLTHKTLILCITQYVYNSD